MEYMKTCSKCNISKPLTDYYKHKSSKDGYLGECIECKKQYVRERLTKLRLNPEWAEKERGRIRNKYHKLNYKEAYKPNSELKKIYTQAYYSKYPEKIKVHSRQKPLPIITGNHLHHWNYNKLYWEDTIELTSKEHTTIHRFIIYDQERMMYRRVDNSLLLDTKELHLEYITSVKSL